MNKRLEEAFGERIAEKRGWHWALTGFFAEVLGETENAHLISKDFQQL